MSVPAGSIERKVPAKGAYDGNGHARRPRGRTALWAAVFALSAAPYALFLACAVRAFFFGFSPTDSPPAYGAAGASRALLAFLSLWVLGEWPISAPLAALTALSARKLLVARKRR